jgi:hypothetical protein
VQPGSGLQGLRDRIAAVNGTLTIDSQPGAGTILRARLPITVTATAEADTDRGSNHESASRARGGHETGEADLERTIH